MTGPVSHPVVRRLRLISRSVCLTQLKVEEEMSVNNNAAGEQKKPSFKDSLKSMDTEETFDLIFYRPIGYAWALLAKRLGITPNAITIASIFRSGCRSGILLQ